MITSTSNPRIKQARKLATRKGRQTAGQLLVEGVRLIADAWRGNVRPDAVFYAPDLLTSTEGKSMLVDLESAGCECIACAPAVFVALAATLTPQGIAAVLPLPQLPWPLQATLLLILDGVSDPGNAGTLVRSAEAAGCDGVIFAPGTVDPFNDKVVRAAMGTHFRLPIRTCWTWEAADALCPPSLPRYLADVHAPVEYAGIDWRKPGALIVSNEAHGASVEARARSLPVCIPMSGAVESLNASVAGSVILFEAARQRRIVAS